jgi:hypothetical protein
MVIPRVGNLLRAVVFVSGTVEAGASAIKVNDLGTQVLGFLEQDRPADHLRCEVSGCRVSLMGDGAD